MEDRLTIVTKDGISYACKFTQGLGVPTFVNVSPDGAWDGASTLVKGERNRKMVSAAGTTPDFTLEDKDNVDRFNFVGVLEDGVSLKRLFLFRDMVNKTVVLVPDLYLEQSIAESIGVELECKYYVISKFTNATVSDSVEIQRVDVTEFASNVQYSDLDIYTSTTGITGRRNVQLFMLGSDETVLGSGCRAESNILIPNTYLTSTQLENGFRKSNNLILILTF